jgi:phosphatidate cytidylyltransferase
MRTRLISAATVLTPILLFVWLDDRGPIPGLWLLPLVFLAGLAGCGEVVSLFRAANLSANRLPAFVGCTVLLCATCVPIVVALPADCPIGNWGFISVGVVAVIWTILLDAMRRFSEPGGAVSRMGHELFAVIYVTLPICFLIQLRLLYLDRLGLLAVVSVIFIVKVADSGAYFAGSSLGKHKMAPTLSPKKTWEGAVGAVVAAMIAALIFSQVIVSRLAPSAAPGGTAAILGYGASLAIAGMIGDLGESLIKRDVGQKDSASWLPGLGGVLDMLDSLLLAAPVGYLWWTSGLVAGIR